MSTESEQLATAQAELATANQRLAAVNDVLVIKSSGAAKAFGTMADAGGSFVANMNAGAQGLTAYNGLVTAGGQALAQLAGKSTLAQQSLGALAGASASLITAIFKQSDALFKSYQDISQIGAAESAGMQGVFDSMQKFGYSIEELPKFGALLAQNSEMLSAFGGSVALGTKKFASVAEDIQRSGLQTEFQRLGMSVDSINKGTAAYLKTQTMTGASGLKTQAELTAGAAEFIRQQDILTKLTGKSAEALLKNEEARMADGRYNAVQSELEMKAEEARASGDEAAAKAFERQKLQNQQLVESVPAGMKKGVQDLLSGLATTKEAQAVAITNNQMAQKIQSGKFEAADVLDTGARESAANKKTTIALGKAGVFDDTFGAGATQAQTELAARVRAGVPTPVQAQATAVATQKAQIDTPEAAVANQVAIRQAQQETTKGLNSMVQVGVHPATAALKSFAIGMEAVATRLPGTGDKTGLRNTPGRGDVPGTGFQGNVLAPAVVRQNQGTIGKFNAPGNVLIDVVKNMGVLSRATPAEMINTAAKATAPVNQSAAKATAPVTAPVNQSAAETARLSRTSDLSGAMARIIEKTNLSASQYTGPISTLSSPVGDTRPTESAAAPIVADNITDSGLLTTSMQELLQSNRLQQSSLDELVDLSRRNLAQSGKLLQAARS